MINKKVIDFIRIYFIPFFIILGFSLFCSDKKITFEEQFDLNRFKLQQFDFYNPILNTFKLDPIERKKHPDYYYFDAYFDDDDRVRYSFYRSGSYGYLQEFIYTNDGRVSKVRIYPILVNSIDKNAEILTNEYYYINGNLKAFRDELNRELILINEDSVFLYKGILSSPNPFCIKKINPNEYFIHLLH